MAEIREEAGMTHGMWAGMAEPSKITAQWFIFFQVILYLKAMRQR